jgi:hypothetical protein
MAEPLITSGPVAGTGAGLSTTAFDSSSYTPTGQVSGGTDDNSASIAQLRELTLQGARDNVELAKIGVLAQRIANEASAWKSIQSNLKSGVASYAQIG